MQRNIIEEERFLTDKKVYRLKEEIYHHSYITLEEYFTKFNRYTTEGAKEYYRRGKKPSNFQIIFNPIFKFIRMYIIRLGFLDGIEGLMIASTSAMYSMVKYFKPSNFQIIFNPIFKFIRMYIIRLGFLDGIEGLMIASTSAMYSMVKYFKLREMYKNNSYKK